MNGMSFVFRALFSGSCVRSSQADHRPLHGTVASNCARLALLALAIASCDSAFREDKADPLDAHEPKHSSEPVFGDTTSTAESDTVAADSVGPSRQLLLALRDLVGGSQSRQTWFSDATANSIRHVDVDSKGHATVDFSDLSTLIPNASSSAGSAMLLQELDSTVFSVPHVQTVEYRIMGSCARFWEWLQYSCQIVDRKRGH